MPRVKTSLPDYAVHAMYGVVLTRFRDAMLSPDAVVREVAVSAMNKLIDAEERLAAQLADVTLNPGTIMRRNLDSVCGEIPVIPKGVPNVDSPSSRSEESEGPCPPPGPRDDEEGPCSLPAAS